MASPTPSTGAVGSSGSATGTSGTPSSSSGGGISSVPASLNEFEKKYPKEFKTIMLGLAQTMITQLQQQNDQLIQTIKQGEQSS
jgi:hypothetical protein